MKKITEWLSAINWVASLIQIIIFIIFLFTYRINEDQHGMSIILLAVYGQYCLFFSYLLVIPMIYFITKLKFENIKWYCYSHFTYVLSSLLLILYSMIIL